MTAAWDARLAHAASRRSRGGCRSASARCEAVSTRHFPDRRGSSALNRVAGVLIERGLAEQIAVSKFVAQGISEPSVLLYNGVPPHAAADLNARRILMMQRLEQEKSPDVGVRAWASSGLATRGWHLAIAGSGRLESATRRTCAELGVSDSVRFLGDVADTAALLREASILIAPASAEPFGLAVAEAMAHGIPVVAAAGGAHLETVGADGCLFSPRDAEAAGSHLARLGKDIGWRREVGARLRARQRRLFSLDVHVERLEQLYSSILFERPFTIS
jgi:glycosyltransferase involved in cell wall biosynthesis